MQERNTESEERTDSQHSKVIELELDENDGVYKPSRISRVAEKQKSQVRRMPRKQQREIQRIADQVAVPEVQQFLYGVNTALDIVERFKKAFR